MRMHAAPASGAPVGREVTGAPRRPSALGELKDGALHLAGALARTLPAAAATDHRNPSLASGSAGLAVCTGQLARTRSDQMVADVALTHLEEAVDVLATEPLTSSLYSGFTGIAWAVELVDRLLGNEGEDRNGDIDDVLTGLLHRYPERRAVRPDQRPYRAGRLRAGPLAASRCRAVPPRRGRAARPAGAARHGRPLLVDPAVVARSARGAVPARRGRPGRGARHRRRHPVPRPGAPARPGPAGRSFAARRVREAGFWPTWWTRRPGLPSPTTWPTVSSLGPARSAWCYGDPGVAAALLLAARDVGEPAWAAAATDLAVRAAARPAAQTGVADAGLCHGSAGLAHLFGLMYQMTAEAALADAARFWVGRTLEQSRVSTAPGWLEGAAGVALAMEPACTTAEPAGTSRARHGAAAPRPKPPGPDAAGLPRNPREPRHDERPRQIRPCRGAVRVLVLGRPCCRSRR